jgi:gamma-glutamyl-gamma-aminobutyrate hydrolase PuuD
MPRIASAYYPDNYFGAADAIFDPDDLDHDLLILWGGEDISPSLYGDPVVASHAGDKPSRRDAAEMALATRAVERGIPILGICRGHQLLGALNGNKLFQHVDNHIVGSHAIVYKGQILRTNSCHHQMVIPTDDMEVIAYAPCLSRIKITTKKIIDEGDEVEVAYFPKLKAIGVQGHPEWLPRDSDLTKLTIQLLQEKLGVSL